MPWSLKNVALDPAYAMQRRVAPKLDMEPVLAGGRIRLRQQITITDEEYAGNVERIASHVKNGVITCTRLGPEDDAPTTEPEPPHDPPPEKTEMEPPAGDPPSPETDGSDAPSPDSVGTEAAPAAPSTADVPQAELVGGGYYVLRLEGEEIDKVRGKAALRDWYAENGYAIPQMFEEPVSKDS